MQNHEDGDKADTQCNAEEGVSDKDKPTDSEKIFAEGSKMFVEGVDKQSGKKDKPAQSVWNLVAEVCEYIYWAREVRLESSIPPICPSRRIHQKVAIEIRIWKHYLPPNPLGALPKIK